jgi:hypothetical protein
MRHARNGDLEQIESLIARLRGITGLTEKTRGVFYLKSKAFLHFHQDPKGMFADVRTADGTDFERFQVDAVEDQDFLVAIAVTRAKA